MKNAVVLLCVSCVLLVSIGQDAATQGGGEHCVPGETPPAADLVCLPSGEWEYVLGYLANARKGDIILTGRCKDEIAGMLRQVIPEQLYAHTGMMTENYIEIRHSTAEGGRMWDSCKLPYDLDPLERLTHSRCTDGLNPDTVRVVWPGGITQNIDDAYVNGTLHESPEGKVYVIRSFASDPWQCDQDAALIFPKVVKPAAESEQQVRPSLERAADELKTIETHYRFFAYSDGSIAEESVGERAALVPDSGWARGTRPTMCSSYLWLALKRAGVTLEGNGVEPADFRAHGTLDGLYRYPEAERIEAGSFFHEAVADRVYEEEAGWFGEALTDVSDDVANQLANCFAFDNCSRDAKDSEAWRNPGDGETVAPDDIPFWDPYDGLLEDVNYQPGGWQPVHTWQRVGERSQSIQFPERRPQTSPLHRLVTIHGSMNISDDENGPFESDEHDSWPVHEVLLLYPPDQRERTIEIPHCAGAEVRGVLQLTVRLNLVASGNVASEAEVQVFGRIRIYEGESCGNDDLDGTEAIPIHTIAPNREGTLAATVHNRNERVRDDRVEVNLTITNARFEPQPFR